MKTLVDPTPAVERRRQALKDEMDRIQELIKTRAHLLADRAKKKSGSPSSWTIEKTPKDPAVLKKLREIASSINSL
jgi:hypothetical protein